jgi:membrane protease YdiL (CAAX protease family)
LIFGILIFLRIGLLGFGLLLFKASWIPIIYEIGTYFFSLLLIYWERRIIDLFNIDYFVLLLILVLKPIETIILKLWGLNHFLAIDKIGGIIICIISLLFSILFIKEIKSFKSLKISFINLLYIVIGIFVGIITIVILAYPSSFQVNESYLPFSIKKLLSSPFGIQILYQSGYAGVSEEPLFRGFIWGYLIKFGFKNWQAFLAQVFLFMLAHIYYINTLPISLFIIVPIGAISTGLIVWKTKNISSSIAAHGVMNGLGYSAGLIAATLRLK